jgi:CubicO group peptidase (beta-lactamase class C family)
MYKKFTGYIIVLLLICVIFSACSIGVFSRETEMPETGASERHNLSLIEQMKGYIADNNIRVNSFILIKDGETFEEAYFNGTSKDTPAPVYSCTKSVMSALVGIAIDEGSIKSVDEKIVDLLDVERIDLNDESKHNITLKHLLTMSSGLDPMLSDEFAAKDDPVRYILEKPMLFSPGEVFAYTSGGAHLVSAIIQRATSMETSEYAQQKLFDPLGIPRPEWRKDKDGLAMGGFGLELTPMQLAAFGSLYLKEGVWNGERVISKEWISESTDCSIYTAMSWDCEQSGYGYYWWMNGFGGYSAHGYSGQYIFVLPEHNAVAVFTSRLSEADFSIPYRLMKEYVIPALGGNG